MSRDVDVSMSMRALDVRGFVADFVKKYARLIEDGKTFESEGDVLACLLDGLDDVECWFDPETGCWHAEGLGECNSWWAFDGFREFFAWCAPRVESSACFGLSISGSGGVYWHADYKVSDGSLAVCGRELRVDNDMALEPPKASRIIEFLKRCRPEAGALDNEFVITVGMRGFGWMEVEDMDFCAGGNAETRYELDEYDADDERAFGYFFLSFQMTGRDVRNVTFDGPVLDWNNYIVYDDGLTADDVAAAVGEFASVDPNRKFQDELTY